MYLPPNNVVDVWRIPSRGRRGVTRAILGGYLPGKRLVFRFGRWGKPRLAGNQLQFNVSFQGDLALLAVSLRRAVGVDLTTARPDFPAVRFAERYFARGEEGDWCRLWARKEALAKAAGRRIQDVLSGRVNGNFVLLDLPAPPGHAACVAVAGRRGFRVVTRTWGARR